MRSQEQVTSRTGLVTLNTRGTPLWGTRRAWRHARIGAALEEAGAGIACFQEVHTWYHLRTLARAMPSFRHACYRPAPAGPAGGLLVLSRAPGEEIRYRRLPARPTGGLPVRSRLGALHAGALLVRTAGMTVINVHPTANRDGDWSPSGRHVPLQRAQLAAIADLAGGVPGPVVACGDYNVARDSGLFTEFLAATGMTDALGEACPPTFRPEYLEPGRRPQCIDFILTSASVKARHAQVILDGTPPLSDHLGLYAELCAEGNDG